MRTTLGILLVLLGVGVMLYGLGGALLELLSLYQGAMSDPLAEPAVGEKERAQAMMRSAIIGAVGIPFFVAGSVLLKVSLIQRLRRRQQGQWSGR